MQDIPLRPDEGDFYKRVVLDHTELITRVSRLEERASYSTCGLILNTLMLLVVGTYAWITG